MGDILLRMGQTSNQMKVSVTTALLICACTALGQIPEMEPRDSTFLKAIDIFLDSLSNHRLVSEQFVIGAVIGKLEVISRPQEEVSNQLEYPKSNFKWSYQLALKALKDPMVSDNLIASCKFKYRNRDVYLFFGAEYFVRYLEKDRKKLKRVEPKGWNGQGRFEIGIGYLVCDIEFEKINVIFFTR
jgi:hypothetical protein